MEIHTYTKFDRDTLREFWRFGVYRGKGPLFLLLYTALAGYTIAMYVLFPTSLFLAFSVLTVLLDLFVGYHYFIAPNRRKIPKLHQDQMQHGVFYEDHFDLDACGPYSQDKGSIAYSGLMKVYERSRFFYLMTAKNLYMLISKEGLSQEEVLLLRQTLQRALPPRKYHLCHGLRDTRQ